jgi:tetratricopeptide (TPR) repeat protein
MTGNAQRAWAALEHGRHEIAEKEFRLVLAEDPDDAHCHAGLGLCLSEQEKLDDAEREAQLAIGIAPHFDFTHYVLGHVLLKRNRFKEAEKSANEAIRLDPDDANNRYLLSLLFGRQRQWKDSLEAADAGLAIDAEHDGCANLRAHSLTHLGRKEEAATTIAGALERSPENSLTHSNQGWALLHRNDPRTALVHFQEALRLDPSNDWAREGLLTALKASNPFYRGVLAFFLFLQRQGSAARWIIIIGILVGQQFLFKMSRGDSPSAWAACILAIFCVSFVALTWLANPLMNIFMQFHPHGRHALTNEQRLQSSLIGSCLVLALGAFVCEIILGDIHVVSLMILLLCIPVLLIHQSAIGWPRRIAIMVALGFLMVTAFVCVVFYGVEELFPFIGKKTTDSLIDIAIAMTSNYFWGILIWSLAGNFLISLLPKR